VHLAAGAEIAEQRDLAMNFSFVVKLPCIEQNCAIPANARRKAPLSNLSLGKSHYISGGTAMERLAMLQITKILAALVLALTVATIARAQVPNLSVQTRAQSTNPLLNVAPSTTQSNILLNVAPPTPQVDPFQSRIPTPLPTPSQPPAIDGPLSQPLPAEPMAPGAPPSVFGSTPVPSVFQAQ
jgi:hypothetical protein